jgi:hypothetical protein
VIANDWWEACTLLIDEKLRLAFIVVDLFGIARPQVRFGGLHHLKVFKTGHICAHKKTFDQPWDTAKACQGT